MPTTKTFAALQAEARQIFAQKAEGNQSYEQILAGLMRAFPEFYAQEERARQAQAGRSILITN